MVIGMHVTAGQEYKIKNFIQSIREVLFQEESGGSWSDYAEWGTWEQQTEFFQPYSTADTRTPSESVEHFYCTLCCVGIVTMVTWRLYAPHIISLRREEISK